METLATVKNEVNIELVQNAFADFLKGDIQGVLNRCTNDVVWSSFENPVVPYGQTYHGKKGVGDFFATLAANIEYTAFDPKEFFADSDRVFVRGHHAGKVKSTGKTFGHDFLMEFRVRDGKVYYFFAWVDSFDQARAFQGYEKPTMDMHDYFSRNQFDQVLEHAADDIQVDANALGTIFKGANGLRDFMQVYKQAFPDMVLTHTNIFSSGNQVAVEFIASGTNTGPLQTPKGLVPATGKPASLKVSEHWTWDNGKIKSIRNYTDAASLLMQLGLL